MIVGKGGPQTRLQSVRTPRRLLSSVLFPLLATRCCRARTALVLLGDSFGTSTIEKAKCNQRLGKRIVSTEAIESRSASWWSVDRFFLGRGTSK